MNLWLLFPWKRCGRPATLVPYGPRIWGARGGTDGGLHGSGPGLGREQKSGLISRFENDLSGYFIIKSGEFIVFEWFFIGFYRI